MKEWFRTQIARIQVWWFWNFKYTKKWSNSLNQTFISDKEAWAKQEDKKHLEWIYNRMKYVHAENPNYDYMIKFREIIDKI